MRILLRVVLVGTIVTAPVVATATPASACGGVQCTINCVEDLIENGLCRL